MDFSVRGVLADSQGHASVADLRGGRLTNVPWDGGVYFVLYREGKGPAFLKESPAGWFKGRDPTVHIELLQRQWVPGAPVIYIGKGDDLNKRIGAFIAFGAGKPVGHWGGRLVWQIAESPRFLIAWRKCSKPREQEKELLLEFEAQYGRLPFANLQH